MVMPAVGRCDDQIAVLHREPLAVDSRVKVGAAIDDEPQSIDRMPVRPGDLAGQGDLHTHRQGGGGSVDTRAGVDEGEVSASGITGPDSAHVVKGALSQGAVPQEGYAGGLRAVSQLRDLGVVLPLTAQMQRVELLVEVGEGLVGLLDRRHVSRRLPAG